MPTYQLFHRIALVTSALLITGALSAQPAITDSTYLRMPDRGKAMESIRFDLKTYNDTLRAYRDGLEQATSAVDASTPVGEERKARLGRLRRDVQELNKDMARLRKKVRKTTPPFEEAARKCAVLMQRTKALRVRLEAEGAVLPK